MTKPIITFADSLTEDQQKRLMSGHTAFLNWLDKVTTMGAESVHVRDVAFFGPRPGFVFAEAKVPDGEGSYLPGLAFIRGDAVAMLIVLHPDFKGDFAATAKSILVHQAHVAIGEPDCATTPAGMMDGDGHVKGRALQEIKEETGIDADKASMIDLGSFYPSSGGCDEAIHLFAAEITMPAAEIEALHGRLTGLAEEHEHIKLEVCSLTEVAQRSGTGGRHDMKTALANMLYLQHLACV